jgi:hypothetical protein
LPVDKTDARNAPDLGRRRLPTPKAKTEQVGTAVADLTICCAVPPDNEVLPAQVGVKPVAMLLVSPEAVVESRSHNGKCAAGTHGGRLQAGSACPNAAVARAGAAFQFLQRRRPQDE